MKIFQGHLCDWRTESLPYSVDLKESRKFWRRTRRKGDELVLVHGLVFFIVIFTLSILLAIVELISYASVNKLFLGFISLLSYQLSTLE